MSSVKKIEVLCRAYGINHYTINPDNSIDVDGDVVINLKTIHIPIKFNHIKGNFTCIGQGLTSLKNGPKIVDGYFDCFLNHLTSLVGAPIYVSGDFTCDANYITNIVDMPMYIGGVADFQNNFIDINSQNINALINSNCDFFHIDDNFLKAFNRSVEIDNILNK